MSRHVVFRADASRTIGTGHVMRCLSLARALREMGATAEFICRARPGNLTAQIAAEGFSVRELPLRTERAVPAAGYASWLGASEGQDAEETLAAIAAGTTRDWVVADHYGIGGDWEGRIRRAGTRLMVIDDLVDRRHDCNLLLNQNLLGTSPYGPLLPSGATALVGPQYSLLHQAFADAREGLKPRVGPIRRVLVFFGGADTGNMTGLALEAITNLARPDVHFDVVLGGSNGRVAELTAIAETMGNVNVHVAVPNLARLMARADLALGAGGTTTWERLCLGLRALVVTTAENQVPIAHALAERRYIRLLGGEQDMSVAQLAVALAEELGRPLDGSADLMDVVDGLGARRVAAVMLLDKETRLRARPVSYADAGLLLDWTNDPETRTNGFATQPVSSNIHRQWLRTKLANPASCRFYVVETEQGVPLGPVRFDLGPDGWTISYSLDVRFRKRGLGRGLLLAGISALRTEVGSGNLVALVRSDNMSSLRIFSALDFATVEERDRFKVLTRRI